MELARRRGAKRNPNGDPNETQQSSRESFTCGGSSEAMVPVRCRDVSIGMATAMMMDPTMHIVALE